MKLLIYILPLIASAQIHLGVGVVDISDRMDGNTLTYHMGYRQGFGDFGLGFNHRYTGVWGENFRSWEFRGSYRVSRTANYRLELGAGAAFNQKNKDVYPVIRVRNAFKISDGIYAALDFDNSFRYRNESYLSVSITLDYDFIKDVFGWRPRKLKRFY